ncbi:MAG: hypothetical protein ACP5UB_08140 [Candidatus Sumerlaeaceae bacterium]
MKANEKLYYTAILLTCFLCLATLGLARPSYQVRVLSPQPEEVLRGPDVVVWVECEGLDIRAGCHSIHLMLDNEPFVVKYDLSRPQIFHDVAPGTHTLRVYAANPYHEIVGDTLCVVPFAVEYHDGENRPERGEPLLTYVLPQGEYRGIDCADIVLNFAVSGAPLSRHGYRVQYYVDGRRYIMSRQESVHLRGLKGGYHTIRMELIDERGRVVPGPFNAVQRTILLSPEKELEAPQHGKHPVLQSLQGPMTGGRMWVARAEPEVTGAGKEQQARSGSSKISVAVAKAKGIAAEKSSGKSREQKAPDFEDSLAPVGEEHVAPPQAPETTTENKAAEVLPTERINETTKSVQRSEATTTKGLSVRRVSLVRKDTTSPTLTNLKAVATSSTHTEYVRSAAPAARSEATKQPLPTGTIDTSSSRTPMIPPPTPPMIKGSIPTPSSSTSSGTATPSPSTRSSTPTPQLRPQEPETTRSARSGKVEKVISMAGPAPAIVEQDDSEESTSAIARVLGMNGAAVNIEAGK